MPEHRRADAPQQPGQSDAHEYRVTWQRTGLPKRRKLYQRRAAAEAWVRLLNGEPRADVDPDDYACCPGTAQHQCGCGGVTNAEAWEQRYGAMPPLVAPPTIESRPVGAWS